MKRFVFWDIFPAVRLYYPYSCSKFGPSPHSHHNTSRSAFASVSNSLLKTCWFTDPDIRNVCGYRHKCGLCCCIGQLAANVCFVLFFSNCHQLLLQNTKVIYIHIFYEIYKFSPLVPMMPSPYSTVTHVHVYHLEVVILFC